jgi:hypothetical protein
MGLEISYYTFIERILQPTRVYKYPNPKIKNVSDNLGRSTGIDSKDF